MKQAGAQQYEYLVKGAVIGEGVQEEAFRIVSAADGY